MGTRNLRPQIKCQLYSAKVGSVSSSSLSEQSASNANVEPILGTALEGRYLAKITNNNHRAFHKSDIIFTLSNEGGIAALTQDEVHVTRFVLHGEFQVAVAIVCMTIERDQ